MENNPNVRNHQPEMLGCCDNEQKKIKYMDLT
jgi:hypothetical protein